jgi:hypothetical protein
MKTNEPMKIDLYTKIILTTIALSLVSIVFRDVPIISSAKADPTGDPFSDLKSSPTDQRDNVLNVRIVGIKQYPSESWETLWFRTTTPLKATIDGPVETREEWLPKDQREARDKFRRSIDR